MAVIAKILAFAGSARQDSWNKKLIRIAAAGAQAAGAEVTLIDPRDYPLPLFDQDDEAAHGLPAHAVTLKALMRSHQGFLISSPEYNSSISPLLKNLIDWTSRPAPDEPPLACFSGKVALLMSASPGALGGLRGLVHVRAILGNIGTLVLTETLSVVRAHEAFNEDGSLRDPRQQESAARLGATLANFLHRIRPE